MMEVQQSEPLRSDQVVNSAGGFVWQVNNMTRLRRFLVLGSELPTYYFNEIKLTEENKETILKLLEAGRGLEVVNEILVYSKEGRAPKQDYLVYALAVCARLGKLETKRKAYEVLSQVCRIPTDLFLFVEQCEKLSAPQTGWGRAHRKAIQKWYTNKQAMQLAKHITKYQKRNGWSHKDLVKLMHLKPRGKDVPDHIPCMMSYILHGWTADMPEFCKTGVNQNTSRMLEFLRAVDEVKSMDSQASDDSVVQHIKKYDLVREHIPTQFLNSDKVWRALLKKMPMKAMIRNLGKMTAVGVLRPGSNEVTDVCSKLTNESLLKNARIHPFNVLVALMQYQAGHGEKGNLTWGPVPSISQALQDAFYKSFKNVEATKQRFLTALDVSGSMTWRGCAGSPSITPAVASAAMAMVTARTEEYHHFVAFSHEMVDLDISERMNLEDVLCLVEEVPMGGTDCALPVTYALEQNMDVDVFIVYTDCETRVGSTHPSEALREYRRRRGINAKLIVVAMQSNGFTIADPEDPGMFDMVGFDSAAPQVMREFIMGDMN